MTLQSRSLMLAASLIAMPMVGAMAQTNPAGNYGSNTSMTASPGTADNSVASGMSTGDANSRPTSMKPGSTNEFKKGATGQTVVPGSNSSIASTGSNTATQKTGTTAASGEGGGK